MGSFLKGFSQRKPRLLVILAISVMVMSLSSGMIRAQAIPPPSPPACAVTPNLLGGQGFRASGQGFRASGQGFRASGQGFSVSGQGFRASGQSLDPVVIAAEITDNPIVPGAWVSDRLDFFLNRLGFNLNKTAILIVDEFSGGTEPHGVLVKRVVDESLTALKLRVPTLKVDSFALDISDASTEFNADVIKVKIEAKVTELQGLGYSHFVINMSFGLIPCEDAGIPNTPAFNFNEALQAIAANNQATPTLPIVPMLECVVRLPSDDDRYGGRSRVTDKNSGSDDDSSYMAYFGYKNENAKLVTIAIGTNNQFTPIPQNRNQPSQFEPGRQKFVFVVKFKGSNLTWTLKGPDGQTRTAIASRTSTPCLTPPATPTQPVTPIVECVADLGAGVYEARFGYNNPNALGVRIAVGTKNKFAPIPEGRGQVTTFIPGQHTNVFKVSFTGTTLSWTLGTITVTGNSTTTVGCAEQEGFGISQYLTQNLGVPEDQLDEYWRNLSNKVETDEFQSLRTLLRQYLSASAVPANNFSAVIVASSGNLRPWLGDAPLAPASWKETIAVGATLDAKDDMWSFSQDGNVVAPGAGYPLGDNSFAAGTSFAAPTFSVLVGMCATVPTALKFKVPVMPPLIVGVTKADNALIGTTVLSPLLCKPNSAPTITAVTDQSNKEGETVSLQALAADVDSLDPDLGDVLSFSAVGLPPGLTISSTGLISGTLAANSAGTYPVTVTVTDNVLPVSIRGSVSTTFNWVVTPAHITVQIDIRPRSPSNRINLSSHGYVAVAIFGSTTFDVTLIDPSTVTLAGAPAVKKDGKFYSLTRDVNNDGKPDRILWFQVKKLQLTATSTEAVLLGKTIFNVAFRGVDSVTIVPPRAPRLTSPASGSTVRNAVVKLSWGDDEDWEEGDNVCYKVEISKTAGFTTIVQGAIVVDRETMNTSPLPNGTYYWRVAFSNCASTLVSPWSAVWSFKVQP